MEITRRDFLKLFGGMSGAVLLGNMDEVISLPDAWVEKAQHGPKIETWHNTICGLCPSGCGLRVRLLDGIPVGVKGNPVYPVNKGGLCPLGLNSLHSLYHPDRIKGPIKRTGPIAEDKWVSISWDEALKTISERLIELRNQGAPHQVAFLGHTEGTIMQRLIRRFMDAFGSPNYFQYGSSQNDAIPYALLQGHSAIPAYDILNARLVVSFGSNFLEEGYSPVYYTKLYSHHDEQQTRYVQIESRMSLTAANADQWIPVRPGTYGALALGLAYILIREELYDSDFVLRRTFGFEDRIDRSGARHVGFKNMVLGNYYPEKVEEITGVPSATILKLGRELGITRPALVMAGQGTLDNTNGTFAAMAVHSLNALLGNFERKGGVFFVDDPPFTKSDLEFQDSVAREGLRQPSIGRPDSRTFPFAQFSIDSFAKRILSGTSYPISVLFISGGNPVFESPNGREVAEALKKIPLVISLDRLLNETSEHAHLVLPDHHFMERWDEVSNVDSVGFAHVGIQHPMVSPMYDTKHCGDTIIDLARRIGGSVGQAFAVTSYENEVKEAMKGVYQSGSGAIVSEGVGTMWIEYLQQRGWQIGQYASFEEFWDRLVKQGGWWNPIRKKVRMDQMFPTTSGKFEFYSQNLKERINSLDEGAENDASPQHRERILNQLHISARGDNIYLPHHEPVPHDVDMPVHLTTFRVLSMRDGQGASLPMMQEMFGHSIHRHWETWVEMHPETAATYHITDGAWVLVQSTVGTLRARAKLSQGIMPNVIAIPFGLGHTSMGRYAKGHGANPYAIMKNVYDMLSGKPALQATKVMISRVM